MLDALAERPPPGTPADFALADLRCVGHIVIGPGNLEHLLLRTSQRSLTIRLTGQKASRAPVHLTFLVPGLSSVKEAAIVLASLPDLITRRPRWRKRTRDQELMRDAFIALDARSVGASHRQAAEVIFGVDRVREEWSGRGGWLKERMRRALAKGQELRDGGYRSLLANACRFQSRQYDMPRAEIFPGSSRAFHRREVRMAKHRKPHLLTTAEAAEYLRLKKHTLENMRWQGTGPVFLKLGGRVFYDRTDLEEWCDQARRRSSSGRKL